MLNPHPTFGNPERVIYQFQADGWDAPIAVAVTFSPAGVSAVSPDGFEFTGSREQWERFEAMGWAKPA